VGPLSIRRRRVLLLNISFVSACALVYELALSTLASFTLGDAVREFSITLGLYLFAMGLGALASQRMGKNLVRAYVACELLLAITGAASVPVVMHVEGTAQRALLYAFIVGVGTLVGIELPLLLRLQKEESGSSEAVSTSLASDYAGSLLASILFPLVAVPVLGLVRTSLLTGAVNAALASGVALLLPRKTERVALAIPSLLVAGVLVFLTLATDTLHLVPRE
jgi:spermidine synthase